MPACHKCPPRVQNRRITPQPPYAFWWAREIRRILLTSKTVLYYDIEMCVRVLFEIGHEASIRAKRTPEGFTHDWEVFVRGADNTEISHFVEKVVFLLHETFPKPKRVVKEPPYSVKESGYAGFVIPIEVYFKNHDEPKKAQFNYDLQLQPSGPPISKVIREKYVFPNPSEDLRRRLIKGGGVGVVGSDSSLHISQSNDKPSITITQGDDTSVHKHSVPALVGKPKLGGDSSKKHKVKEHYKAEEPRVSSSFTNLFGTPIKTTKVSPDPKKSSHSPKVSPVPKISKSVDKSSGEKQASVSKSSKHASQKESKDSTERSSTKEERKEKSKERDKSKEKTSKRPSTSPKRPSTPPKRPPTPPVKPPTTPPKRPSTPPKRPPTPPKHIPTSVKCPSSSPKHSSHSSASKSSSKDEAKKSANEEVKKLGDSSKGEKKKKDKKNRDEKPKKDKHKEHEKEHESKVIDKLKNEKSSKDSKEKDSLKKIEKDAIKDADKTREKEKDKTKHSDGDKEKQRHKHKKKDKSSRDRDKEREKEKERDKSLKKSSENKSSEIKDREKNGLGIESNRNLGESTSDVKKPSAHSPSPIPVCPVVSPIKPSSSPDKPAKEKPSKHPLDVLLSKVSDNESSDSFSPASDDEHDLPPAKLKPSKSSSEISETKTTTPTETVALLVGNNSKVNNKIETVKSKTSEISNQERESPNKSSSKPLKEKSSSKKSRDKEISGRDVEKDSSKAEKDVGRKRKRKSSGKEEVVESGRNNEEAARKLARLDPEPAEQDAVMGESVEPEVKSTPAAQLTEEYVSQLKELQHKIMTLEDNAELQRVVQVIAETGQYEITKKTFDFDLCALDRSTVQRLQAFFTPS
ncbi:protein ENL isoform X1 [Anabrus simplex]|uniref:protein ENL isoform X1 n=1 Tax=Anabrus simplex TaxID=316456 RepID=UPI0035A2BDEA